MAGPILIAEDLEDDAEFLQLTLQRAGAPNKVVVVHDGKQALDYLEGRGRFADRNVFPEPSVLMLDLMMPGVSGFGVLDWIQKNPRIRDLLVVVLSGHHYLQEVNYAYSLGAHWFLVKPCHEIEIANLMKAFPEHWTIPTLHDFEQQFDSTSRDNSADQFAAAPG